MKTVLNQEAILLLSQRAALQSIFAFWRETFWQGFFSCSFLNVSDHELPYVHMFVCGATLYDLILHMKSTNVHMSFGLEM